MPSFPTVQAAQTWCTEHFPTTVPASHWSVFTLFPTWFEVLLIVLAYFIGREGLSTLWSDIKGVYSGIRGLFSGTKTAIPTTTTVSTAAPVATSVV